MVRWGMSELQDPSGLRFRPRGAAANWEVLGVVRVVGVVEVVKVVESREVPLGRTILTGDPSPQGHLPCGSS